MQRTKMWASQTMPLMLALVMIVSMCLVVAPVPEKALAGETIPELIAPGHTTQLNEGQFYIVTAELENWTGERLVNLYARLYAKQAESPDVDSPPTGGLPNNELIWDPAPIAPGTQDGGQDWDTDNDNWIENGSPSLALGAHRPAGWNEMGLTTAGPDDGINLGTNWSDDEGSGDNAWPWIDTWELGGDRWMEIKDWVASGSFTPDCAGVYDASTKYTSDFASFNHIRMVGDEPTVKQLDPLMPDAEITVGWQIQCIGDGDVDIRVYFWEEGVQGEDHPDDGDEYVIGTNCAGLMWAGNEELDSPCHSSLPDPADRDDWVNVWGDAGAANNQPATFNGNDATNSFGVPDIPGQWDEDWIWFTESQLICQGEIAVPDIEIEIIELETCIPVGTDFDLQAVVTNNTPCDTGECVNPGTAVNVVAEIDRTSLFPKVDVRGGTETWRVEVGELGPGESEIVTFELTCLVEGLQENVIATVTAQPQTCVPQSCWACYQDDDQTDIWQCGNPELEVEITSPKDFMWDPGSPMYEGAAIHTGGEFAINARIWNIGAAEAEDVIAVLRDIPMDPKTEKPYFVVINGVETSLSAALSPTLYQDAGMEQWIPGSSEHYLEGGDTYNDNYSAYGYQKYLGDIGMGDYKTVEFTLMPTATWMEVEQSCNEVKLTGFTVVARRTNGYPQSSGAMIDDGSENFTDTNWDRKSAIAKWISNWTTGDECDDGIMCNQAACGNSFVSLQGTPMYQSGTFNQGWVKGGTQARVIIPEPKSFDLLDDIAIHVNSGTEATYGGYLGLEVGLGPFCCRDGGPLNVGSVNLPIIQINIENLAQDIQNVNGGADLETTDTGIHITYQPGTPGWRKGWNNAGNPHSFQAGGTGWDARAEWMTDGDCSTWEKFGTHDDADILADGPSDGNWIPGVDSQMGWVIDWDDYSTTAVRDGNLSPYDHYTWDQIQAMFDRGVGTPAIATIKSIEIKNNSSGTPLFVDDIRITDDFHGDLKKGDGPSEYTNDCDNDNYLNCACPGIIEAPQVLIYPAADLNVEIDGPEGIEVTTGGTINFSGVVRNDGAVDAWDVVIELDIVEQPGFGMASIASPEGFTKQLHTVKGDGGTVAFSWILQAYVPGLYRFEVMPSGIDECGWHVKQNADPHTDWGGRSSGGNLLLVDDSADYPIQWLLGDQMTAYVGVPAPDADPSIEAEITYPGQGQKFFKDYEFAVQAVVTNDGDESLANVAATLTIGATDATFTTIVGTPTVDAAMDAGDQQILTWIVEAGSVTGDCAMQLEVTGVGSAESVSDVAPLVVRIDPPVELVISAGPGGSIGITADCYKGAGEYMFDSGDTINIKAVADAGMQFAGWAGDTNKIGNVNDATTSVDMLGHYNIMAVFADGECTNLDDLMTAVAEYMSGQISVMELMNVLASYLSCS